MTKWHFLKLIICFLGVLLPGAFYFSAGSPVASAQRFDDGANYSSAYRQSDAPGIEDEYVQNITAFKDEDIPPTRTAVIVTKVISADTLVVNNYGVEVGVRLWDIYPPEINTPEGEACREYLQNLVEGKAVTLEHDNERDEEGYLLATVYFSTKNLSLQVQEFFETLMAH